MPSAGVASGSVIGEGGFEVVSNGGLTVGAIAEAGGVEFVAVSGTASGAHILGAAVVASLGSADGTLVSGGGVALVYAGGTVSATQVLAGGTLVVLPGATAAASVVAPGGLLVSTGVVELASDYALLAHSALSAKAAVLRDGAEQYVLPGGAASGSIVSGGSVQRIYRGGVASAAFLNSGGYQMVSSGGIARATIVSGGALYVWSGGIASAPQIDSGGRSTVAYGGSALAGVIAVGGEQFVFSGGTASATRVGGTEQVLSGAVASGSVVLAGGVEQILSGGSAAGVSLGLGGEIDLADLAPAGGGGAVLNAATDVLTVTEGSSSVTLQLAGNYSGEAFTAAPDNAGGTAVTDRTVACFCRGTPILTDCGEVAVEALGIGDLVLNSDGEARPNRWIGRRAYAGRFAAANRALLPILIEQDAIDDHVPNCDLLISPMHALLLEDVLIPAGALVNGGTIRQLEEVTEVAYFHLELDSHDVILAAGVEAETYLDHGNRGVFQNAHDYHAESEPGVPAYCAPRLEAGLLVSALRRRFAERGIVGGRLPLGAMNVRLAVGVTHVLVPARAGALRLTSPSAKVGTDTRRLGALVTGVAIEGVALDLTDTRLARGFNDLELHDGRPVRWTNGDAVVVFEPDGSGAEGRWCEITVASVVEPEKAGLAPLPVAIRAAGTTRVLVPAGATALRLVSGHGWAPGDCRRLGALLNGLMVGGEIFDLADDRLATGFHQPETHGLRTVRWTDGDAMVPIEASAAERWCEIEVFAAMERRERGAAAG